MNSGVSSWFQWKSKAVREKEQAKYEAWAFPHGKNQRKNLEKLMQELCPKEQLPFLLVGFLSCKELYEKLLDDLDSSESVENTADIFINSEKKYKHIIKEGEMARYVALVLADAEIDERCEYPSADEMRERITVLDARMTSKKGR